MSRAAKDAAKSEERFWGAVHSLGCKPIQHLYIEKMKHWEYWSVCGRSHQRKRPAEPAGQDHCQYCVEILTVDARRDGLLK